MKNLKLFLIAFFGMVAWNCTNPNLEFEEEDFSSSRLQALNYPEEFDVSKLLKPGYPVLFGYDVTCIFVSTLGAKLLKLINTGTPYIYFVPNTDFAESGEMKMGFAGSGKIYYTPYILEYPYRDELLFHEFVHVLQNKNSSPVKSRNNEIEAYVAQYLYVKNKGGSYCADLIDPRFSEHIQEIVTCIDEKNGKVLKGKEKQYEKAYRGALNYLNGQAAYSDKEGYFSNFENLSLPHLEEILKQNL